ncbi:hypothetical protein M427DRAFT_141313 [Gonapodya prolifera JEL478]|uniref:J domain-containing protein n=1 Tax=Gonapodya prolifera (strain JEL478) TaxID=1344416 RepID=A0A138ZXD9_GONPJ|nr:hypothetical protein M427DRAFT_141313 [Gonapodya prolifera JEL478]|eukprot:KXS09172.1 hypothetical protein M427DRAFT_141313 [Gonapodya prolifera JEL478]
MLLLPPPSLSDDAESHVFCGIAPARPVPLEPVGLAFLAQLRRRRKSASASEDSLLKLLRGEGADAEDDIDDVPEAPELLALDPLEWKTQDHYRVLGLETFRWKASDDEVRRAYRRKALKHHPDKKSDRSDDSFFKCIQKAWEVVGDPVKRRQWDSVDPMFEDSIPPAKPKGNFYKVYGKAFENNARFSKVQPVPQLGDASTSRDEVESFYDFWFNFDSWRTFEAYDEEDPEKGESREEKRWIERQNKVVRLKMKKDDNARLSRLVEQAMKLDPRLAAFKEQDRLAKEARKKEREDAQRRQVEEAKAVEEAVKREKERLEEAEKAKSDAAKKDREARKKLLRKERKALRDLLVAANYHLQSSDVNDVNLAIESGRLEEILENFGDNLAGISTFRAEVTKAATVGSEEARLAVEGEYGKLQSGKNAAKEKQEFLRVEAVRLAKEKQEKGKEALWSPKELAALITGVKVYPGGTISRWEKIASYVNMHGGEDDEDDKSKKKRFKRPDDCIKRSNDLKNADAPQQIEKEKLQAVAGPTKHDIEIKDAPTVRYEVDLPSPALNAAAPPPAPPAKVTPAPAAPVEKTAAPAKAAKVPSQNAPPASLPQTVPSEAVEAPKQPQATSALSSAAPVEATVWSAASQQALESALRAHPASKYADNPNERWKNIAQAVQGKTVKEVKARVKELAELAKRKRDVGSK